MRQHPSHTPILTNPLEPRWPAVVGVLAVGGLYLALPKSLSIGPRWMPLVIISILVVPTVLTHRRGHPLINRILGHLLTGVITLFMLWSLGLLLAGLPAHKEPPAILFRSAACLWITNILIFASWYWRLDAGGPHVRAKRLGHPTGSFLFPQMTLDEKDQREPDGRPWSPKFVDYLFLAFNTSTALSPTDTPILSRWAKGLAMLQSLISLTIIVVLVARGVNIL